MSRFHYATLTAHVDLNASDIQKAQVTLGQLGDAPPKDRTREQIENAISLVSTHEHECFHCRATLSTTIGWLLFYVAQVIKSYKVDMIAARRGIKWIGEMPLRELNDAGKLAYVGLNTSETIWRMLNFPSLYWWDHLRAISIPPSSGFISGVGLRDHPWSARIRAPSDPELEKHRAVASLPELLEAHAVWKEYCYASVLALAHLGPLKGEAFYDFTDSISQTRLSNLKYKRIADLVLRETGHSLAKVVVGFLLDIALCPPVAEADVGWSEFHPCARLVEILRVWRELNLPSWTHKSNFESVPEDAYEQLDNIVAEKLGWRTALSNVQALSKMLFRECGSPPTKLEGWEDFAKMFRFVFETNFAVTLHKKGKCGRLFVYPTGSFGELHATWVASAPLITVWKDEFWVNGVVIPQKAWQSLYVADTLTHLFLEDLINMSPSPPMNFQLARQFHRRAADWLASEPGTANLIERTFDRFASRTVGYKWTSRPPSTIGL